MGVINNLIQIRKKFKAIVGENWDGTTISSILNDRPTLKIVVQPVDTDEDTVTIRFNLIGVYGRVQRLVDGSWVTTGGTFSTGSNVTGYSVSLSNITETSLCRIIASTYGGNADIDEWLSSDAFTVTRTAAQTQSLKTQAMKENLSQTTDLKDESI